MELLDIREIEIHPAMIDVARSEQQWLDTNKQGAKTRDVYHDKNVVGSLAHQCVEMALEQDGVPFTSYRTEKYRNGDTLDILYENDHIDVKGTHSAFNQMYYYNKGFLVFSDQLEDEKIDAITHFCFVEIEPDYSCGRIYGVIRTSEFIEKARTITLQHENKEIKAYQLTPFAKYVWRV